MGSSTLWEQLNKDTGALEQNAFKGLNVSAGFVVIRRDGGGPTSDGPYLVDTDDDSVALTENNYNFIHDTYEEAEVWASTFYGVKSWSDTAFIAELKYTLSIKEVFNINALPKLPKRIGADQEEDDGLDDVDLGEDLLGIPEEPFAPVIERQWFRTLTGGDPVTKNTMTWDALESLARPIFETEGRDKDQMVSGFFWRQ